MKRLTVTQIFFSFTYICEALRDLAPFVLFKKREKHTWKSVLHRCFSRFLNSTNGAKSRKASHLIILQSTVEKYRRHHFAAWLKNYVLDKAQARRLCETLQADPPNHIIRPTSTLAHFHGYLLNNSQCSVCTRFVVLKTVKDNLPVPTWTRDVNKDKNRSLFLIKWILSYTTCHCDFMLVMLLVYIVW